MTEASPKVSKLGYCPKCASKLTYQLAIQKVLCKTCGWSNQAKINSAQTKTKINSAQSPRSGKGINLVSATLMVLGLAIFIWAPYQAYQNWTNPDLRHYADGTYDRQKRLNAEDHSYRASVICEEYVRQRLKAPSTAEFPFLKEKAIRKSAYIYLVHSYVDAQNSFGAKLRSDYYCEVQRDDSDNWRVTEFDLSNR